jgi:hypothetical protein
VHRKLCEGRRKSEEQRWKRVGSSKENEDNETQYENKMELQYRRNTRENMWTLQGDCKDHICLYVEGRRLFFPEVGRNVFLIKI